MIRRSNLTSYSTEELVERFKETAIIHQAFRSPRETNRAFDEGVCIWAEIKGRDIDAIKQFQTLLESPEAAVRLDAAALLIFEMQDKAVPILEQLSASGESIATTATMTLREWRAGRLKALI